MANPEEQSTSNSLTVELFENKFVPILNSISELIISHPDIPEGVEQADLLGILSSVTTEMRNVANNRVPELVKRDEQIARKDNQIKKLQETNQQLYLKVGTYPDPNKKNEDDTPPKKTFAEIKAMIEKL